MPIRSDELTPLLRVFLGLSLASDILEGGHAAIPSGRVSWLVTGKNLLLEQQRI